jgi:CheY-like chemotaxis protein
MNEAWTIGEKTVTAAPRVLVVEDEPNIRELVCLHLGLEGYACEGAGDGKAGLARIEAERFDLLVLDVMLPGLDGVSLCRAVRRGAMNGDVPILMLTARGEESDKVIGLESGAATISPSRSASASSSRVRARCCGVRENRPARRRSTARRSRPDRRFTFTASTSTSRAVACG